MFSWVLSLVRRVKRLMPAPPLPLRRMMKTTMSSTFSLFQADLAGYSQLCSSWSMFLWSFFNSDVITWKNSFPSLLAFGNKQGGDLKVFLWLEWWLLYFMYVDIFYGHVFLGMSWTSGNHTQLYFQWNLCLWEKALSDKLSTIAIFGKRLSSVIVHGISKP